MANISVAGSACVDKTSLRRHPQRLRFARFETCTPPDSPRRETAADSSPPAETRSAPHRSPRLASRVARPGSRATDLHRRRTTRQTRLRRRGPIGPQARGKRRAGGGRSSAFIIETRRRANFYSKLLANSESPDSLAIHHESARLFACGLFVNLGDSLPVSRI